RSRPTSTWPSGTWTPPRPRRSSSARPGSTPAASTSGCSPTPRATRSASSTDLFPGRISRSAGRLCREGDTIGAVDPAGDRPVDRGCAMREQLRMALVLNGGVSLAVWMGGVVHELDLLRRACSDGLDPAQQPRPYDQVVFDRWRELSRAGGRERAVVVDVIAGTSAGGLNGALLATAVANKGSLDPDRADPAAMPGPWLREQWAELGALTPGQLLPPPDEQPPSVLDGLSSGGAGNQVTLFLTASGLGPHNIVARDAAGQAFSVADHRFLYRFSR